MTGATLFTMRGFVSLSCRHGQSVLYRTIDPLDAPLNAGCGCPVVSWEKV